MGLPVGSVTTVPVKSALTSKINWLAAITGGVNWIDVFTKPLPATVGDALISAAQVLIPVIIIVARTWFTNSVTAASTK